MPGPIRTLNGFLDDADSWYEANGLTEEQISVLLS